MVKINKDHLYSQLVKLGDTIDDGDHEPWVEKEYSRISKILGIGPKRKDRAIVTNKLMEKRVQDVRCQLCSGRLKQTRSGSMRAKCVDCGARYQLLSRGKKK